MDAIEIRDVTKQFRRAYRRSRSHPHVADGTIYGFIGLNGPGKTTTIRMIMNMILPDRGQITVLGQRTSAAARDAVG